MPSISSAPSQRIHYVTTRNVVEKDEASQYFGEKRGPLHFGMAVVNFPEQEEGLAQPLTSGFSSPRATIQCVAPETEGEVLAQAAHGDVLLFVHGFNVSFDGSVARAGQLARLIGFEGSTVLYSWPAPLLYPRTVANAEWSARQLASNLQNLVRRTAPGKVHVIAHSMGGRVLLMALERLRQREGAWAPMKLGYVVLAAPDIDADIFEDSLQDLSGAYESLTVYASNSDQALFVSARFNGTLRVGDGRARRALGVDTIIVPDVEGSFIGHSYYRKSCPMISDLRELLASGKSADKRNLQPLEGGAWQLPNDECSLPIKVHQRGLSCGPVS